MDAQSRDRDTDATIRRVSQVAALIVGAAVIVIPYTCGRTYRRWLGKNDPFDTLDASIERFEARYRERTELAHAFGEIGRGAVRGRPTGRTG